MNAPDSRMQAPPSAASVYAQARDSWTLATLEQRLGFTTRGADGMEAQWLDGLREVPFAALADDDLGMLLARGMHIPVLLPVALARLQAAVTSRLPPSGTLIEGCGRAAKLVTARAPELAKQADAALRSLLQAQWAHGRVEVLDAVYAALS